MRRSRKIWAAGAAGAACFLLSLWGIWRGGTAADVFPERAPPTMPAVQDRFLAANETGRPVLRYDANTYIRTRPLRDPFRLPEEGTAPVTGGFSADRPRLQGVLILGEDRRAMVETGGRTATVKVGEQVGLWTVMEIAEKRIVLSGPAGQAVLSL